MKLHRLDLLRYGHLTDVALAFPDDARLHVVLGANEAGKSTALAAIADALFGFGNRSGFDFLHGGSNLRIGFTLSARDGAVGRFIRRKGRRDTLRDGEDRVLPGEALRRFLGGAGRDLFERGFGLDAHRLREGGQALLRAGGEVGESLLAGTGLPNLRAVLGRLEEEAKSLVGDGRGRRRLSVAIDAWRTSQRDVEDRIVAPRDWKQAEEELAAATSALADVQRETSALTEESSRLQRVRRVAARLTRLAGLRATLQELADVPRLPASSADQVQTLLAQQREAERDLVRESAEGHRLKNARVVLPRDEAVLQVQDAVEALVARAAVVAKEQSDLPAVRRDAAVLRAAVKDAVSDLGSACTPEEARDTVPSAPARRSIERLIKQHASLETALNAAEHALAGGLRESEAATAALAGAPEPAAPVLLRKTIEATREEGPLERHCAEADATLAAAEANLAASLRALPLWDGDLPGLMACKLPLQAEAERTAAQLAEVAKAAVSAREALADVEAGIARCEAALAGLAAGEPVPTREAVAEARDQRDRTWRLIRRGLDGDAPPSPDERAGLRARPLPDAFETLLDAADRLSDRRAEEAERVARWLEATAELKRLRGHQPDRAATLAAAEQSAAQAAAAWQALWVPAGVRTSDPAVMTEWRREREAVLGLATMAGDARRKYNDLQDRIQRAHQRLCALLPGAHAPTVSALLLQADTACAAAETALADHRRRRAVLEHAEARLPGLRDEVRRAQDALHAWQGAWEKVIALLGLGRNAPVEAAEAALKAWSGIAEKAPLWRTQEMRVRGMEDSIARFGSEVARVAAAAGEAPEQEPAPLVASRLARRLAAARSAAAETQSLDDRIKSHRAAVDEAGRRRDAAGLDLARLQAAAGVADIEALHAVVARAQQREAAAAEANSVSRDLLDQGDGRDEAALRAEAAGIDSDAIGGRIADIKSRLEELGNARERFSAELTTVKAKLAGMRSGHDAATAAQRAQDALADARTTAERYARLRVAQVLLGAGIERFRKLQQDPLLAAASRHFARLTDGRYERLVVDQDEAGRAVLLAMRDADTECRVEALSEGTRDQLHLALRTARVQTYAETAEPLPFIADDLLVQFDDVRAAAAIALLAELGRSTQVILFTHHEHIAALAEHQPGAAVQRMAAPVHTSRPAVEPVAAE